MKNRKILAMLLSVAMICSSLPAYAAVDDLSSGSSFNTTSQSSSIHEGTEEGTEKGTEQGTEANQNDESSSQAEMGVSSEVSGHQAVNNEESAQPEENHNIPPQNAADAQDEPTEQSVYDINNGDMDICYIEGVYYTTQNDKLYTDMQAPVIVSYEGNNSTANDKTIYLHDFVPDKANAAPYVIIRDLCIKNHQDCSILEVDSAVGIQVEGSCKLETGVSSNATLMDLTSATIDVDKNADLTIYGSGSLEVDTNAKGAAIGGAGMNTSSGEHTAPTCGNIEITGDVRVIATNGGDGAAIGGGYNYGATCTQYGGDAQNITIGGNAHVTATSDGGSAAIGGGGVKADFCVGVGGDCASVTIKDNARVEAKAEGEGAAAIGSGANCDVHVFHSSAGDVGTISILDYATVYAVGKYVAIGSASDFTSEVGTNLVGHSDPGKLCVASTTSLEAYSGTDVPINSECKSVDDGLQNNNIVAGSFKNNSAPLVSQRLQVINADLKYIKELKLPIGTESFAFSTPSTENYKIISVDSSSEYGVEHVKKAIQNIDSQTLLFTGSQLEDGKLFSDYLVPINFIDASVQMNLSQGSITISKIDNFIYLEQNGRMKITVPNKQNISILQSPEQTENSITVKGNVDAAQPIILENINIRAEHPIVVEEGADVNFIFHNNNRLVATDCEQSIDYPAIEVPNGATVTLSGDGSLKATANGYAAAIGTRGYYRDFEQHTDGDKSSGTVQIDGNLNMKAYSAYGAGIGGGAINGSFYEQHAFDNGTVIIKGNAVVEVFGSTKGGYSAGIGGGGCYTSTCAAVGGDGGDVQILDHAHVTAVSKGRLGAGIGGGGGCGKTADGFGGDGESFKADGYAVVLAVGAQRGPGIGGGGARQKSCCATHPGNSGSCSILGNSNVTAQGGEKAENFGSGGHTGGWANYKGRYTDPVLDETAIFNV